MLVIYMCIPAALSAYLSSRDASSHSTTATTRDLYLAAIEQYKLYIYNTNKIHIQHTLDQRYIYDITSLQSRYGYWLRGAYGTYDTGGSGASGEGNVSSSSSSSGSGSTHQETDLKRSKNLKDRIAEGDVYLQRVYNKLINNNSSSKTDSNSNSGQSDSDNNKTMIKPLFYTTDVDVAKSTGPISSNKSDRSAEALNPFYISSNTCIFPIYDLYE